MSQTLIIRTDASAEIGIGHVMRCLALAQAWQDTGGKVIFALASGSDEIGKRLRSENMEVASISAATGTAEDSQQTAQLCRKHSDAWLAIDGFHFSSEYRQHLRTAAAHLLVFDDHAQSGPYCCDIVLNTNPYATDEMYRDREGQARFLLGPAYALLRREFLSQRRERSGVPKQVRRVLVSFGGSDPHNVTLQVVEALHDLDDLRLETVVVVGASNPHRSTLEAAAGKCRSIRLVVNAGNMPELIASADLAISAGGGTCYELALLKVPMFLITMAQNHERTVEAYRQRGAAVAAGWFNQLENKQLAVSLRTVICDGALRQELTENAAQMVDGRGAGRVVAAMHEQAPVNGG